MLPAIPIVIALGGLALWRVKRRNYGKMTPGRKVLFEKAVKDLKEPEKLRDLAKNAFENNGLRAEAAELRKRAALREAPPALIKARTAAFKKAISSKDPKAVSLVANGFHKVGAYEAASKLRKYAADLVPGGMPIPKTSVPASGLASAASQLAKPPSIPAKVAAGAKLAPIAAAVSAFARK